MNCKRETIVPFKILIHVDMLFIIIYHLKINSLEHLHFMVFILQTDNILLYMFYYFEIIYLNNNFLL